MKSIISFVISFGFSLFISCAYAQTTHSLNWGYNSANQEITIEIGDTVEWTWTGGNHNLVSVSGAESLDSGYSNSTGFTYSYTFNAIGETNYVCTPHANSMYGTITVTPPAPTGDSIQALCPGLQVQTSNIDINTESGASLNWYNSESSTSAISPSSFLSVGDNTYYISQTVNGIESTDRFQVRLLIPNLFLTYNSQICAGTSTDITFNSDVGTVPGNVQSFVWSNSEESNTISVTPDVNNFFPTTYYLSFTYDSGILGVNNLTCSLSAQIYSRDLEDPTFIISPNDISIECNDSTLPANTGQATANDNCDSDVIVTYVDTTVAGTGNNSVITRAWTATDDSGNSSLHEQIISVQDTQSPNFSVVPGDIEISCEITPLPENTNGLATANDNCAVSTIGTISGFTAAGTFENSHYYISNSSKNWTDAQALCVANGGNLVSISSESENSYVSGLINEQFWIGFTDQANEGQFEWADGSTSNFSKWAPNEPSNSGPTNNEDYTLINTGEGGVSTSEGYWNDVDNNTSYRFVMEIPVDLTVTYADTTVAGTGNNSVITRVWTATDANGNATTYTQTITVVDTTAPTFIYLPGDLIVECNTSVLPENTNGYAQATDNCDSDVTVTYNDTTVEGVGNNSVITRLWTATDDNSNVTTYTQNIFIYDSKSPTTTFLPDDITIECGASLLPDEINGSMVAIDNCDSDVTVIYADTTVAGTGNNSVITRVWTATDDNSNSATYTQTINIVDTTAPTFTTSPANVTVECSASSEPSATGTAAASDNCDSDVTVTYADTTVAGTGNNSVITRVWTATDDNSNATTYTQTIIVKDNTAPTVVTQAYTLTLGSDGTATLTTANVDNGTSDNCDSSLTLSLSKTAFDCTNIGENTVTLTATDDNSNSASATAVVTVVDTTAPTFTTSPASVTVECSASTEPSATGTAAASDNCDSDVTVTYADTTVAGTGNNSVITRVWTATDDNSNATTYTQTITVVDTTAPTFTTSPANVTIECSASSLPANTGQATASDNCDSDVTVTYADTTVAGTGNNSVITRVWTATDDNSNATTYTQTITVEDTTSPTFTTSPSNVTVECDASSEPSATGTAAASDNCDSSVTVTYVDTNISGVGNNSSIVRLWTATDDNGNATTYTQTITVVDTTAPVADVTTLNDITAECSVDALTAPTATDNCEGPLAGITTTTFPITTQGTTVVTWTFEDASGNISTQTQNVIINDVTAPVADVTTLNDITAECSVDALTAPTATDNCEGPLTGITTTTFPITTQGTTVVTWTFEDASGNISTQTQNVIINDVTAPVADVTTLNDITAECSVDALTAPTATDNCEGPLTGITTTTFPITTQGTTVVTWTFEDASGNISTQTQNVIINDVTAPVADVTTLNDITAECSVDALTAPTATDNCEGPLAGITTTTFPITTQGTTVVTWTFEDASGNISTQTQNVIINDVTAPVADVTTLNDITAECSVDALTAPTATDNCEGPLTGITTTTFPITTQGTTVVTWTFEDASGNISTQTQNVIINDVTAPVADVTTLNDITAECSVDALTAPTATDNCEGPLTGITTTTFPITTQGTTVVTWTFEDASGNISTQTQNVIINDVTAPVADVTTLNDITAECSVDALTAPTATDNCEGPLAGITTTTFPITTQGTTVVTWTFEDASGNISTQTQNVIINDVTAPVADVTTLNDITAECSVDALTAPTATDNCEGPLAGITTTTFPITTQGTTVVTWTFEDASGNISTQTQNVIINDVTAPVADVTTLNDITAECSVDALTAPTATDNCEGPLTGITTTTFPITTQGTTVVTWTFEDASGNISTQTQNVIINDVTAPVADVTTLNDITAECSVDALTAPTATDNCEGPLTGITTTTFPITTQGTTVVTWTFEDASGNISTQTQNVIINDVTAPVADVTTLNDITAECSVDALTAPTATDNCEGPLTGITTTTFPITTQGTTVVTWTFEDASGNISTQTQNVIINDVTAPVADVTTLNDITAECSVDALTAPTATDNCEGTITGITTTTFPITTQGTTVVTWTFEDASGNISTQTQNVIINDVTAPVADVTTLNDITAECSVDALTAPTATDNCEGPLAGITTTTFPITTQGTTVVTWTFEDASGNISTQTQNVIINDVTAPVADVTTLNDITAECSVDALTAPTATDNCEGPLTGITTTTFPITTQGTTVVTWTFEDASGNISTQTQNVIINDVTAPVADVTTLNDITAECSVDALTAPTATDNCEGPLTGITTTTFPITTQGTTVVTWTFEDASGNISTQTQNVIINDVTAPVADVTTLNDITAECSVDALTAPTATDNCEGPLTGITTTTFPITTQGTTVVTWTFEDASGNISTQTQNVIIDYSNPIDLDDYYFICNSTGENSDPITIETDLSESQYNFIWRDELNNILSEASSFTTSQQGIYSLELNYGNCTPIIETFEIIEITFDTFTIDSNVGSFSNNDIIIYADNNSEDYEFNLDGGNWQTNGIFINVSAGLHYVNIKNVNGCGIKTIEINIIDYPKFFTPNGDGFNDFWNISSLSFQPNSKVYIFDRFGKLLKVIKPTGNGWDGTYNGNPMPTNDYWFVLEYNDLATGEPKKFRAHFTLKR